MNWFEWFLTSNSTGARILRTIVQGILGVLVAELPEIVGLFNLQPWLQATIVALVMAILSPIMAEIGKHIEVVNAKKRFLADNPNAEDKEEVLARGFGKEK